MHLFFIRPSGGCVTILHCIAYIMFPIRVSEATIATAHRVMQPGGNQEAKTVVYLSCMIDNLSSRMSKTVSVLGFIHHEQHGFFPGPIVRLSSTTTVNNTDPRIDNDSV